SHPEPEINNEGELEYEVEEVLDSHLFRRQLQYLMKWKGYRPEHNEWIPEENAANSKELVTKFHKEHPNAPRRISASSFRQLPFHKYSRPQKGKLFDWHTGQFVETTNLEEGVM